MNLEGGDISQIFWCQISHLPNIYKFFFSKISLRCLLVHHILRRKTWKSPYLDTGSLGVAKTQQDSTKCVLSSLTCSQEDMALNSSCRWLLLWLHQKIGKKKKPLAGIDEDNRLCWIQKEKQNSCRINC